jgi:hypothetical protein
MMQDEVNESAALERQDEQGDSEDESDGLEAEIMVENLQDGPVDEEMLRRTFEQIGVVTDVQQQYDAALVAFETAEIAQEPHQRFDSVKLCGMKMSVRMVWFEGDRRLRSSGSGSGSGSGLSEGEI